MNRIFLGKPTQTIIDFLTNRNSYDKISRVTKGDNWFLNYIEYDAKNITPDKINQYLKTTQDQIPVGMCTGIYKQGMVLRQLDWYYNQEAEFIIKMKKCLDKGIKYDSIGTTAASPKLTVSIVKDHIENNRVNRYFDLLPYMTVDGVNEMGIFAQSNVVEKNGVSPIDINPESTIDCCCSIMLVRFILDHVGSIDELETYLNTLHMYSAPDKYISYNAHILVADSHDHAKIIEFTKDEEGKFGFELVDCNEKKCQVMTNFRTNNGFMSISSENGISADWNTVEHNGMGVERWETGIRFVYDGNPASIESFKQLRSKFDYAHAYDRVYNDGGELSIYDSMWLTDNLSGDLSVAEAKKYHDSDQAFLESSRKTVYDNVLSGYRKLYDDRSRSDGNKTWITTHSSIYDLASMSCNVMQQVGTTEQTEWNVLFNGTITEVIESPTTGGQWIGRWQAENNITTLQFVFNASRNRWEYVDYPSEIYIIYQNNKWQVMIEGTTYQSDVSGSNAKYFEANIYGSIYKFTWVNSAELINLSVYSHYNALNSYNGRFRFNNDEEELEWNDNLRIISVGKNEKVQLSAYTNDFSIAEFSSWSNGSTSQSIELSGESDYRISASFNVHKVSIYVQAESERGSGIEVPEGAVLKINDIEKPFKTDNYFDKENSSASIAVESSGSHRFSKWKDTGSADVRWLPLNQSYTLTAVFEEER